MRYCTAGYFHDITYINSKQNRMRVIYFTITHSQVLQISNHSGITSFNVISQKTRNRGVLTTYLATVWAAPEHLQSADPGPDTGPAIRSPLLSVVEIRYIAQYKIRSVVVNEAGLQNNHRTVACGVGMCSSREGRLC